MTMNRKMVLIAVMVVSAAAITTGLYALKGNSHSNSQLQKRLAACGSLPNGSSTIVVQTTRMFINLPKDLYPNINLEIAPQGATAGYISNGGPYGYAIGARGKLNCWSYYLDFELASDNQTQRGKVDIGSKSGVNGNADYLVHFNVVTNPSDVTASASASSSTVYGKVHGQVLLGPTCPVERIPPDPACAPKPYKTKIQIFATTVSAHPYKFVVTDAAGKFNFSIKPGSYVLRANGGSVYPRCADLPIKVLARKTLNVKMTCDTGIR